MCDWEWESFEHLIGAGSFEIENAGPLRAPVRNFSIKRNEKLQLILETRASGTAASESGNSFPLGTVRVNTDAVTFVNGKGTRLVAAGVQSRTQRTSITADSPMGEMLETSSVHSLKGTIAPYRDPNYVIEWLANVDDVFSWPNMIVNESVVTKTRTLRGGDHEPVLRWSRESGGGGWSCVKLDVDGYDFFLCVAKPTVAGGINKPGFILYAGNPPDELRDKVKRCLSFCLGKYLVYLGYSRFCEDGLLVSFEAVSAYSLGGRAFELPAMPPSPLGTRSLWEIDRDILSRMVNSLYSHYDTLRFGKLTWAYWHALCATPHIAAVHFGAAAEALQRAYLKASKHTIKTKLVEGEDWKTMKSSMKSVISGSTVSADVKRLLENKLGELNAVPQSVVTERVLESLQIKLGERERKVWTRRNVAAHGSGSDEDLELIRDLKILRLRFHRMLLSITNASDFYYDYFSIGQVGAAYYPARRLKEPIP
ncbi:MAG: hypothetical protein ACRD4R_01280 [Candidatus Acidiferrales bacterium]